LSQGSNYFRFEDSLGFVWITGNDAVNRYDGSQVKVFNLNKYFDNCPNLAQAYGIVEDNKTNIYFGSTNGLYCYERQKGVFNLIDVFTNKENQLTMPIGFFDNKIWCFNNQYQIVSYDVKTKKIILHQRLNLPKIPSVHVYNLNFQKSFYQCYPFIDTYGNAWFCGKNKVIKYTLKIDKIEIPLEKSTSKNNFQFNAMYYDVAQNEILFSTNKGLIFHDIAQKNTKFVTEIANQSVLNCFAVAKNNNLLCVFKTNLLTIFNTNTRKLLYSENKNNAYYNFGFDKNNRFWFCDDGKGQVIFDFKKPLLNKVTKDDVFTNKEFNGISCLNVFNSDQILINSHYFWNTKTKSIEAANFTSDKSFAFRTSQDKINKGVWMYDDASFSGNDRLFFLDANKEITKYASNQILKQLGIIQDVKPISKNLILIACEKGLYILDKKNNQLKIVPNQKHGNAFYINPLSKNRFAVSYINHDLLLVKYDTLGNLTFDQNILPKKQSFYVQENSQKQNFWVGTNKGLFLLDKNFKILKTFDANSGMAGTYIYGLLLDDFGTVWTSHQRGLSSINAMTNQVINYDLNDGVQDWDFNNRAFCKTNDGTLYFGGAKGFNYIKPPLIIKSSYKPKVYIDEILINLKTYKPKQNANECKELSLEPDENSLSVKTSILDIQNASSYKIAYRLDNDKWTLVPNIYQINFNSLSPNHYKLHLGVYNKFTNKISNQKVLRFTINSPFYKTIWFWSLMTFAVSTFIYMFINSRKLAKQKNSFEKQLALEQQRIKITADLHDDIGATLSSLQLNSAVAHQLMEKNPVQTRALLTKIENQSKDLADKIGDIIWSMKPGKEEFMTISSRIKNFANDILAATNCDFEIKIDATIDTLITDITTRKNIVLITKEAINNSAKYSKATKIKINFKKQNESLILQISDNGIGFDPENILGNGIGNMKKRAKEINAVLDIKSAPQFGTKITLQIPYPYI
jgi:signal transduction histidine kinase/ligand-binding sensor domain-containing protein